MAGEINPKSVRKNTKAGYKVAGKNTKEAKVKCHMTDAGGTFYVYDLYGDGGELLALNRYVFENNAIERPFAQLTKIEKEILNPPVVIPKEE